MDKIRVLFLAAAPSGWEKINAESEYWAIDGSLNAASHRDRFDLNFIPAIKRTNFLREMLKRRPHIVHFSGHGNDHDELVFEGEWREPVPVSPEDLQDMFGLVPSEDRPKVAILSACYSEHQAAAVANVVDCTIGMPQAIRDSDALAFSGGFYNALGEGLTVDKAVAAGRLAMTREASELPKLHLRQGDSPPQVQLMSDGPIDEFPAHVDRKVQLECFRSMLGGEGPRMLVLTAEGTMGKSELMRRMAQDAVEAGHPIALPDLTSNTKTPHDVLDHLARDLDIRPLLAMAPATTAPAPTPPVMTLESIHAQQVDTTAYQQADPHVVSSYQSDLEKRTCEFVAELNRIALDKRMRAAILLDGFDDTSGHLAVWIEEMLLPAIARSAQIICVVAGRAEPNIRPSFPKVRRERLANFHERDIREMLQLLRVEASDATANAIWVLSENGQPFATVSALEKIWRGAKGAQR
jgi:CHAT domain